MIVREKPELWDLLTAMTGSVIPRIAVPVALLAVMALALAVMDRMTGIVPRLDGSAFAVFGIGLSLFLGFRNNAAYDRWWEARKLWGGLLADLRSLAREAEVFLPDPARREELLRGALVFLHAHRMNLRGIAPDTSALDGFGARALTTRLASIAAQQAGCERIANSPLPFVYSLLIYRTAYLYCLLLPLALVGTTGLMTPVFVAVVGYMFLGLAEVTEELSHPFATTQNGIALDAICRAAEISLLPHLGEAAPAPLRPVNHFLS